MINMMKYVGLKIQELEFWVFSYYVNAFLLTEINSSALNTHSLFLITELFTILFLYFSAFSSYSSIWNQ